MKFGQRLEKLANGISDTLDTLEILAMVALLYASVGALVALGFYAAYRTIFG